MQSLAAGAALVLAFLAHVPAQSPSPQSPSPQAAAIVEGLDWHCAGWMKRGASDEAAARHTEAQRAGWRERTSAAPAVGPILQKRGEWGQATVVRVLQDNGHRCSISLQLARDGWTTDIAHAAVSDWTAKAFPAAYKAKDRGPGPRSTRETVWNAEGDLSITLQEAPSSGAQPNVFITLARTDRKPVGI